MADLDPPGSRHEETSPAPDQARPDAVPALRRAASPAPGAAPGQAPGRHKNSPDPGCYEARHGLTGWVAMNLAAGLILLGCSIFAIHLLGISRGTIKIIPIVITVGGLAALPPVILLVGRKVAFRADQAGITLPATPSATKYMFRCFYDDSDEFIPWSHVKGITLLFMLPRRSIRGKARARLNIPVIEIHHRRDAHGSYALRSITTWRLDRNRLAAIVAAAAPDIAIVEREVHV